MDIPDDRRYTADHEWALEHEGVLRVGLTRFATEELGDLVFAELPAVGSTLTAGEPCGEVESTKTVSDVVAPCSGEVVAVNAAAIERPELVTESPYGDGWLFEIAPSSPPELLSAADYRVRIGAAAGPPARSVPTPPDA